MLIVSRLAANDGTQTEYGGVILRLGQLLSNQGYFPGSRNPGHIDRFRRDAMRRQRVHRTSQQFGGNGFVVPRNNNPIASRRVRPVALEYGDHGREKTTGKRLG